MYVNKENQMIYKDVKIGQIYNYKGSVYIKQKKEHQDILYVGWLSDNPPPLKDDTEVFDVRNLEINKETK